MLPQFAAAEECKKVKQLSCMHFKSQISTDANTSEIKIPLIRQNNEQTSNYNNKIIHP